MPWGLGDAAHKTKKASTPAKKKRWAITANALLAQTGDEAKAIRIANAMAKKAKNPKGKRK
jgi:uncharacterized protein YdaT